MKQVRTNPYYPQPNGKLGRVNKTIKTNAIRNTVILSYEDTVTRLTAFIDHYNNHVLHSPLQDVTSKHMLEGTAQQVWDRRDRVLAEARCKRRAVPRE